MYESDQSNLEPQPPEESNNRTFLIAAGILGGIVLLSIACLAGYALLILPGQQKANQQAASANATQNAVVAQALTSTSQAITFPTATVTPSQTPVVAQASPTIPPITPTNTQDPATATVAAALTLAAQAQLTHVPTSTALPGTGIGDQYGAPGLVIVGMALIVVIFLARRLRATPTR
ncbi:MAG: hypothetical protein M1282_01985 [Chloroflexi bacterium]|nr:hypothetical protein [Chloroflexota bacterium]